MAPSPEHLKRSRANYYCMHEKQTVEFVKAQHEKWCGFSHVETTMMEALDMLCNFVDETDPDVEFPNIFHAYQTAEGIRKAHPDDDWLHLTGLIHDVGKIMAKFGQDHWCNSGNIYPVGLAPRATIVHGVESFAKCPDLNDERYNTAQGMYKEGCGISNLLMSWGHNEYLYQVLKNHTECRLPEEALWCIRFHSFFPWHTEGDYKEFETEGDDRIRKVVYDFSMFDVYTKTDDLPDNIDEVKPYYQSLIDKYIPGKVKF